MTWDAAEQGKCTVCGVEVDLPAEPVTVPGWYGGHLMIWAERGRTLQVKCIDVRCSRHTPSRKQEILAD